MISKKRLSQQLFYSCVFLICIFYIISNFNNILELADLGAYSLFVISIIIIITSIIGALPNKILLRRFNVNLNFVEWYGVFLVNTVYNILPLNAGLFAKAIYLKNKYSLPYTRLASLTMATYIITVLNKTIIG